MNFDQQYTHARAQMEGGDWKLRAEIADLKAAAEQLAAALNFVAAVNHAANNHIAEDIRDCKSPSCVKARAALGAWKAAK